ncbi:MAG: hypothetical protein ACOX2N_03645 [Peptococcia bacterium]
MGVTFLAVIFTVSFGAIVSLLILLFLIGIFEKNISKKIKILNIILLVFLFFLVLSIVDGWIFKTNTSGKLFFIASLQSLQ